MSSFTIVENLTNHRLLSHLTALDQYQLEEFKLHLQPPGSSEWVLGTNSIQFSWPRNSRVPWAELRAADAVNLFFLLNKNFSEWQVWEVALSIFQKMNLTSLCEEVREEMKGHVQTQEPQDPNTEEPEVLEGETGHVQTQEPRDPDKEAAEVLEGETEYRREFRERLKNNILATWDNISWPEDHMYVCSTSENEREEMQRLLDPNRTGAQAQTIVLEGRPGVGKTTKAMKAMLYWADGILFQRRFSYVFYLSCLKMKYVEEITFADLLSWDQPNSQTPIEEFMSQSEKLLFVVDGFEEMTIPEPSPYPLGDSLPCTDWYQKLPVIQILLSLLKKELVPLATLLITTRMPHTKALEKLLVNPCFVHITGFTEEDQEEYFVSHFGDQRKVKTILEQIRQNEILFNFCSAPMVCWTVCSSLKQIKERDYDLQPITETTTSLYAYFFSNLFSTAEVDLEDQSWPEQWNILCTMAVEGMWSMNFNFREEDNQLMEVPLIESLLHLNILQLVSDYEDCITFTHSSFQEFFAAMFYVLEESQEFLHWSKKHEEMKIILRSVLVNKEPYWTPVVLFLFGLLKKDLVRKLEDTLHCKMSSRVMEELLEWKEELDKSDTASVQFDILQYFRCLHETQEEDFIKKMLGHIFEADLDIFGNIELRASSFCLKHCKSLSKLRLSVRIIPERATGFLDQRYSRMRQWGDICTVFTTHRNLRELDLSNSELSDSSMGMLCCVLRNPQCQLEKLTCRSITPVSVLAKLDQVLYWNKKLSYLNLSSNKLEEVSWILRALRHPACNLKYLWLESCGLVSVVCWDLFRKLRAKSSLKFLSLGDNDFSDMKGLSQPSRIRNFPLKDLSLERCNLSVATCPHLASFLINVQKMTRLCLGFNQLQDNGVEVLCGALTHSRCTLERLELWFCQLGALSCRHLSAALLKNNSLKHLNLSKNNLRDEGVKFLCEALSRPECNLKSLDLSGCSFTAKGCQELADALKHNHNLKILDIGRNDLQDDGVKLLCEALKASNCALNTLGLEKCNLTAACCQHLSSVLSSCNSLVNLNLIGNDLETDGAKMLCEALRNSMCNLQKLGLQDDLHNIVREELLTSRKELFLKLKCTWDFNNPEDRWWW
ncbi:NACHT, LRR and PYD domains-containing protein 13 [Lemur catta]|uniref:NACHT, LRR and PYD domains-containing protein 13 n=1 Tax=Lemur catta TaxID=9447 RepID=UPI001E26C626|nr:NACHT, LRR and PYD domains-containing protein 13 [Lemur catta]